jgi:hypothetical protein
MKIVGIILMNLLISHSIYSKDTITNCRDYYYGVCLNEVAIEDFDAYLALHKESEDQTIKGYHAVIWFLWADFYVNPIKKWKCFSKGKNELEELINADYNNIELRFLRLTIQDNVPAFLGYNQNIKEDKDFLYNQLNNITDKDLRKRIISYLSFGMAKLK